MIRRSILLVLTLALVSFAGCMEAQNGAEDDDPSSSTGDSRIPPADDPGWEPMSAEGVPREMMHQPFQARAFLQEPEAAEAEGKGNDSGDMGFNLTEVDEQIGPLEEGSVYHPERSFPPSWDIVFTDVNWDNRSLTYEEDIEDGTYFDVDELPGGTTVLIDDEEGTLAFRLDLDEGAEFYLDPTSEVTMAGFPAGAYRVVSVEEDTLFLDHHPAGEQQAPPPGQPMG